MENLSISEPPPPGGPGGPGPQFQQPPQQPQLPAQMFTTAAQLLDLTDSMSGTCQTEEKGRRR